MSPLYLLKSSSPSINNPQLSRMAESANFLPEILPPLEKPNRSLWTNAPLLALITSLAFGLFLTKVSIAAQLGLIGLPSLSLPTLKPKGLSFSSAYLAVILLFSAM